MSVLSFVPTSQYEVHGVSPGRRIQLVPSVCVVPFTPEEQKVNSERMVAETPPPTSEVNLTAAEVTAVRELLKSTFPDRVSDLDDLRNLELEFTPAYNITGSKGEECWVLYDKRTKREFLVTDGNPMKSVQGYYRNPSGHRPW